LEAQLSIIKKYQQRLNETKSVSIDAQLTLNIYLHQYSSFQFATHLLAKSLLVFSEQCFILSMIFVRVLIFLTALTFFTDGFRPDVLVEKGNYSNFHVVIDENVRVDTCKSVKVC
jgi:hypothetical protein